MHADFKIQGYETPDGSFCQFVRAQAPQLLAHSERLTLAEGSSYMLDLETVAKALFDVAGVGVGGVVAAGARAQRQAAGVAEAERPHPRARRARFRRVVEGVARHPVPGQRVDADDLAAEGVDELAAVGADVLLGLDDPLGQGLRGVGAADVAAGVGVRIGIRIGIRIRIGIGVRVRTRAVPGRRAGRRGGTFVGPALAAVGRWQRQARARRRVVGVGRSGGRGRGSSHVETRLRRASGRRRASEPQRGEQHVHAEPAGHHGHVHPEGEPARHARRLARTGWRWIAGSPARSTTSAPGGGTRSGRCSTSCSRGPAPT